jgi:hypothetical protein
MMRRDLLKSAGLFSSLGLLGSLKRAAALESDKRVMIPLLSTSWDKATPLLGDKRRSLEDQALVPTSKTGFADRQTSISSIKGYERMRSKDDTVYADFALARDRVGRWHCIGNESTKGDGYRLHHHVSDQLTGPYRRLEHAEWTRVITPEGIEKRMYSPFILNNERGNARMFYAHIASKRVDGSTTDSSVRYLTTDDPRLESWQPRHPLNDERNILVREPSDRDPMVLWDGDKRTYFLYYCVGNGWEQEPDQCTLRVRRSEDLVRWSDAKTFMIPPVGYRAIESIFVIKRRGLYYLWICGFDWGRMSLYISEDPMNFGDPMTNRIAELSGHTPEIVSHEGNDWIACAGISTTMGRPWGFCDLLGVYIQPLNWVTASPKQIAKITRLGDAP